MWGTPACKETGKAEADEGRMHGSSVREHLRARRDLCKDEEEEARPYAGKTAPLAELYPEIHSLEEKDE